MFEGFAKTTRLRKIFCACVITIRTNLLEVADMGLTCGAFIAVAVEQRRASVVPLIAGFQAAVMKHWAPDPKLAESWDAARQEPKEAGNFFTAFAKVGKFFWQQMTRILSIAISITIPIHYNEDSHISADLN